MMARNLGRSWAGHALALASALAAAGCLGKQAFVTRSYAIDPPPPQTAPELPDSVVVSLDRVRVAPPYSGTSFVYRMGGYRIERDPYAIFAASPGWMLTSAIRGYLRDADFVRDVVELGGEIPVVASIEVEASELCGDLSSADAAALLTLQFRVFAPSWRSATERELLRKTYTRSVAVGERTAAVFAAAWNKELSEIMTEFLADLKPILASLPPPSSPAPTP
jgi:hypothetical protein